MSSPSLIKKAQAFAAEKQTKANYPGEAGSACVLDAIELAHILEDGGEADAILLAAAVLHATLQNTDATEAELIKLFGTEVAFIVAEVTDNRKFSVITRKTLRIMLASQLSRKAKLVKFAEIIATVRALGKAGGHKLWSAADKIEYFDWSERVVRAIGNVNPTLTAIFSAELENAKLAVGSRRPNT